MGDVGRWYISTFFELCSHRSSLGMGIGQIPVLAIDEYGQRIGKLEGHALRLFRYYIRQLDQEYLAYQRAEDDRAREEAEKKAKQKEDELRRIKGKRR